MEALAFIALAGNIVDFITLAVAVSQQAKSLLDHSANTPEQVTTFQDFMQELRKYSGKFKDPLNPTLNTPEGKDVREYATKCEEVIDEILPKLESFERASRSKKATLWAAFKFVFGGKDKLEIMVKRLQGYDVQLRQRVNEFRWYEQPFSSHY